ncbi:MAG TPA: signal peptidase I [Alphaproteobacteria bacterium]|nr:signal peptidase I [Alphaproteobacteria bacterium]
MNDHDSIREEETLAAQAAPAEVAAEQVSAEPPAAAAEQTAEPEATEHVAAPRAVFGIQTFFTVVIFSIFVITFIVQAFQIPSGSMENTLLVGDFLLVDKLHFAGGPGAIQRGDIVVFYFPVDASQFLVKRVIGLPGDHIRLRNKMVYVNGEPLQENYVVHKQWIPDGYRDNFPNQQGYSRDIDRRWRYELANYVSDGELVVPAEHYFVMGDNRENSLDSRYWGFVPRTNIVGRPLVIYLSVKGSEPGRASDKLIHSGSTLAHLLELARWDRVFRLVR